ncbi:MAG: Fe-S cluster assembly ATPase SufC [Candidatus Omnitrophica bacterium]|nr:Fe-S cluster assembly ATPase SufC [Candidatus Omnitrophota bacterium]
MLKIEDLTAQIAGKTIIEGLNLEVGEGETHAIMGPNGSGKSTLAKVLSGDPEVTVIRGSVQFLGMDALALEPEERALAGIFIGYQYPVEIPGVNIASFLRAAYNAKRRHDGHTESDPFEFFDILREKCRLLDVREEFLSRSVNDGLSGGEKKRNEILQMLMLEPRLAVLDEIDSGLDVDALKIVASGVNALKDPKRSFVLITHYQRLLNYITPDHVHILSGGRIVRSGGAKLAHEIEETGYVVS